MRQATGTGNHGITLTHEDLPVPVDTTDYDAFKKVVVQMYRTGPEQLYALHMALLDGIGHWDPVLRRQHERHLAFVGEAMTAHEAKPTDSKHHFVNPAGRGVLPTGDVSQLSTSGLLGPRADAYLSKVRAIEADLPQLAAEPEKIIERLYEAASLTLLPELTKVDLFPQLVIDDAGDEGTFSRSRWLMEIPVYDELDAGPKDLREISATVYHETRHVEQAWLEARLEALDARPKPGFRALPIATLAAQVDIPRATFEQLLETAYPDWADTKFMAAYRAMSSGQKQALAARMARQDKLRLKVIGQELGGPPVTFLEEAEMALLFEQYQASPKEADAFALEGWYKLRYDRH